jgi:hypothetical protein
METKELRDLLDLWVEEDNRFYHQLDEKLLELKTTLEDLKNIQARMAELV